MGNVTGGVWTREGWILVFGLLALDLAALCGAWLWARVRRRQRVR